ncbi:MAG: (Fe-S)-binding protein, partial [Chloroflexi bacterium]|nr:(Fe-S)-binding protein [Chloroflexota bacterium]
MPEREILWNLGPERFFVYPVVFLALAFVIKGLYDHYRLWRIGQGPVPLDHLGQRLAAVVAFVVAQRRVSFGREPYAGLMHGLIYLGFLTLVLVTTVLAVDDWLHIMFGAHFLVGPVYLGYALVGDLGGVALLAGLTLAFYRRYVQQPDRLADPSPTSDDGRALGLLAFLAVNGFAIEGVRILLTELRDHPEWALWSPVGYLFSLFFSAFAMSDEGYRILHRVFWSAHLLTVALFLATIPTTKFAHILLSTANVFFRDPIRNTYAKGALVPIEDIEQQEVLGATKLTDFTFSQLVGFDGCTNCGRCQDNCPAYLSGKPLSPRKLVQDLRRHLLTDGRAVAAGGALPEDKPLIRGVIEEDTVWACVTCRACMEACPVLIEHIPAIVDLRRSLVMMAGSIPEMAQNALMNMERRGHPWRGTQHVRGDWMELVPGGVPEFTDGDEVEYLYWVGCTGALEDRAMKVTLSVVNVLKAAGVNFGVLGPEETCTGDPARRMGNEFLFQMMAQQTIEILNSKKAKKIITNCPHCFNTMANEYPDFDGHFEVIHHTTFLSKLLK